MCIYIYVSVCIYIFIYICMYNIENVYVNVNNDTPQLCVDLQIAPKIRTGITLFPSPNYN